jgi:hypothetical protein
MIEEAAGTRLYESKKESAQRTIEKKDSKLREIDIVSSPHIYVWILLGGIFHRSLHQHVLVLTPFVLHSIVDACT